LKCAHIGDSQNDIETFQRVGYSIALNSSDANAQKKPASHYRPMIFCKLQIL
jgi:hydroxymethylpyrimidine pyrophosphatase-like HAD family hydrolase